jgi:hypothetical protein
LLGEFSRKQKDCVIDEKIAELNGREVIKANSWLQDQLDREISQVGDHYQNMLQDVNFHLNEALKQFAAARTSQSMFKWALWYIQINYYKL